MWVVGFILRWSDGDLSKDVYGFAEKIVKGVGSLGEKWL